MDNVQINRMIDVLIKHEDIRLKPYRCTAGRLTIGIGRNLDDNGISRQEAVHLCINDILNCVSDLKTIFPRWSEFSENRQIALVDMRFNLGYKGFRSFKNMITAIRLDDWVTAIKEATDSKWFTDVQKDRSDRVISLMT